MNAIARQATVVAVKDQISCNVAEEAVILHITTGTYFGLNEVGAAVWNLIQSPRTVAEIVAELQQRFEVSADQCEADLLRLFQELDQAGLVQIQHGTAA